MEYSGFPLHIKSLSDTGQIEGLAAGYGNVDSHGDIIAPGAFATSIAMAKANDRWPVMLLHHEFEALPGVELSARLSRLADGGPD
jgi:hypothetical protein